MSHKTELQFLVNKRTWERLPDDLKAILQVAMKAAAYDMYTQSKHESGKNWASIQSEYPDVQVKDFPPEVIAALREANGSSPKTACRKRCFSKRNSRIAS